MKILVVNFEYPPLGGGGGDVAKELAKQYVLKNHVVKVFSAWFPGLPLRVYEEGFELFRIKAFRRKKATSSVFGMALFLLFGALPYLKLVKNFRPDIVHVHFGVPTGVLGWLSWKIYRVPYVITGHLGDVPNAIPEQTKTLFFFLKPFTVPLWHQASAASGVSQLLTRLIHEAYPKVPTMYIPNGVDIGDLKPPTDKIWSGEPTLFFAGRLNPQKDLRTLFLALKTVLALHPDLPWHLRVAGDGPMYEAWKREGEAMLGERVTFLGWVDRHKIAEEMEKAQVFVLPSIKEGMPIVCLQAMAIGLPIVATAAEGTIDVVEHETNGLLVPVADHLALAQALSLLLGDQRKREQLGSAGRKRAVELFSWEAIANQYLETFHKIVEKPKTFFLPRLITYNRGDLASRAGALDAIRREFPGCNVFMTSVEPEKDAPYYRVQATKLGWIKDLIPHPTAWRALHQSDIVLWVGGVDLQDDTSRIKIPYVFLKFFIYRLLGKRIMLYAQGMGPIVTHWGAWWTRRVCSLTEVITVRDLDSKVLLERVGIKKDVAVVADAALCLDPAPPEVGEEIIRRTGLTLQSPIVGISIRRWFHHSSDWLPYEYRARFLPATVKGKKEMDELTTAMAFVADRLVETEGAQILFIPMYPDGQEWWEDDSQIAEATAAKMKHPDQVRVYHGQETPKDFMAMIGQLSFMIGMRLHSTILATHSRVPAVHLCYTQKGRSYFRQLGEESLVFPVEDVLKFDGQEALWRFVHEAFLHRENSKKELEASLPKLESLASSATLILRQLMGEKLDL